MKSLLLINARIIGARQAENSCVLVKNGQIAEIGNVERPADEIIDLEDQQLWAGFIDIHNHGAVGFDVNRANEDDLLEIGKFLARQGVTSWVPTFVPDADENYQKVIPAIENLIKIQDDLPVAWIVGVHYEGVFANEKMCGALRPQFFKKFLRGDEIETLPQLEKGIHLTTFAPEVEGGIELVKELIDQNWIPLIGHTRADPETLDKALAAGARHLTHFFNAMTGLHHREVGVVGWALMREDITLDIIADNIHVAPPVLKFACQTKTPGKVSLISDSVAPTGLGDGDFVIWEEKVSVKNGRTQNERGSIAGSVITMLDAVKNMLSLGFSASEVSQMASANPAKLLGLEQTHGSIEVGKRADLVVLDEAGNVKLSMVGGRVAFREI